MPIGATRHRWRSYSCHKSLITEFDNTMSPPRSPRRQDLGSTAPKCRPQMRSWTSTTTTLQTQRSWRLCPTVRPAGGSPRVSFHVTRPQLEAPLTSQQTPTCRLTMSYSAKMQFVRCAKLYATFEVSRTETRITSRVPLKFIRM